MKYAILMNDQVIQVLSDWHWPTIDALLNQHGLPHLPSKEPQQYTAGNISVQPVGYQELPNPDPKFYVEQGTTFVVEGTMVFERPNYIQKPLEEIENMIRLERDAKLNQTDWLIIRNSEINVPVSQEVLEYQQALRDITLQPDFPFNVEWPSVPSELL